MKVVTDSLKGFNLSDYEYLQIGHGLSTTEYHNYLETLKRTFLKNKYHLQNIVAATNIQDSKLKPNSGNPVNTIGPCTNFDFEASTPGTYTAANAVNGWSLSSQLVSACSQTNWTSGTTEFSVQTTPVYSVPIIGTLPNSPLGGTNILHLNDYVNNQHATRLSRTLNVSSGNTIFQFAYAGIWQDGGHNCCEQSNFIVQFKDCLGNLIPCLTYSFNSTSTPTCYAYPINTYSNYFVWSPWQVKNIDLVQYIGTCVDVEIIVEDCIFGGHYGSLFFDAVCNPSSYSYYTAGNNNNGYISLCPSTSTLNITAPFSYYTYQWYLNGSAIPQATLSILSSTNVTPGNVYSVTYNNGNSACILSKSYTISTSPTQIGINGLASSPTCSLSVLGSATVQATGSGGGYNYNWLNSTGNVVGTSSVANNLAVGIYSVTVSAPGNTICGSATGTIAVIPWIGVNIYNLNKFFCHSIVSFQPLNGSNFQWYNNQTPIPSILGGNASSYSATVLGTNTLINLSYNNAFGCKDSIRYSVLHAPISILNLISAPQPVCPNISVNSTITVLSPTIPSLAGPYSFTVTNANNTPSYLGISNTSTNNSYVVNNVVSGHNYNVHLYDGSCNYDTTFTIPSVVALPLFTLSPASATLCSGNSVTVGLNVSYFVSSPYWAPPPVSQIGGNTAFVATFIPTTTTNLLSAMVYSVTHSIGGCYFLNTFTLNVCAYPVLNVTPLSQTVCVGETNTLSAFGALSYLWNNGALTNTLSITPTVSSIYTVTGSNAYTLCQVTKTLNVMVDLCLGLDENIKNTSIKISPNPAKNQVSIETFNEEQYNYDVFDTLGKKVLSGSFYSNHQINISDFESGVYLIAIKRDEKIIFVEKIIKTE